LHFYRFLAQRGIEAGTTKLKNNVIASALLILLGIYLACGFVFAVPFVLLGVKKIDPHAGHGSWGFRLLIIPGTPAFWPLLLRRWLKGILQPPEECNAHRLAASKRSEDESALQKGIAP
jgi:hypothetical protein